MRRSSVKGRAFARIGARAVLYVLACTCLSACIFVPTPMHGESRIGAETVASFEPGRTTRTDVLMALADPMQRFADDRFFVYRWNETNGYVFVGFGGYSGAAGPLESTHYLVLDFGPDGRLRRLASIKAHAAESLSQYRSDVEPQVRAWMDSAEQE
jgi:outer membrane protein assembly factor BamE (lipoprotein component of BamABCDE complex)